MSYTGFNQAEHGIRIRVAASQDCVNVYSTCRTSTHAHIHSPTRAWEVARTVVAPPLSVVKCLWEVFVWGSCRARVCAGVGGVVSVGVSCVRVTC